MKTQLENALAFANNNVKVFPLSYNSKSEQILSSWKNEGKREKKSYFVCCFKQSVYICPR